MRASVCEKYCSLRFPNLRLRRRWQPTLSQPAIAQEERQPHPLKSAAAHKFHTRGAGGDLKGFPQAIEAIFPKTQVQLCIVHQIRTSLRYLSYKYYKPFIKDLKEVYRASTHEIAETNLKLLEEKWVISQ